MLPVTFERNCKSCHARELEFDVYHVLGASAAPAPHSKDATGDSRVHRESVSRGPGGEPGAGAEAAGPGIDGGGIGGRVAGAGDADSEQYLFERKCGYCHETAGDGWCGR